MSARYAGSGLSSAPLADQAARARIERDLDSTLFVEAAAGTGKTSVLVKRIVSLLRSGRTTLAEIVAVTFTEKAAGEMKLRLREELEEERTALPVADPQRVQLELALQQLELARISTIHGFCADLLRERPVEAGVDPLFEVAAEDEAARLLDETFAAWLPRALDDPPEGVRRALRRRRGYGGPGPVEQLRDAVRALVWHRDFQAPWRRDPLDRERVLDEAVARLQELAPLAGIADDKDGWAAKSLAIIARFVEELSLREAARGRDYDALEAELATLQRERLWNWKGRGKWYARDQQLERYTVLDQRAAAKAVLDAAVQACDADLAAALREELREVVAGYEQRKDRAGRLDFLDLLARARRLLRDDREVRAELQQRFSHYFVDEFQDTDPLQAELLLLLAADTADVDDWQQASPIPGKLFIVGDPKQSIYRFRRADLAVYQAVKRRLVAGGAEVLHLRTSFRGRPGIQATVNAAFAIAMSDEAASAGTQPSYVGLEPYRAPATGRPSVVALPAPRPYNVNRWGRANITKWAIEDSYPDAVGAFVDWLVHESGWTVEDREGRVTPIAPRHVCLLFRRFKKFRDDVTRPYVRALEQRSLAHVLVGGRSFHDREEVLAVRNALAAIEWPRDELSVFATLRGPLFGLADDALVAFREHVGRLQPLRRLDAAATDAATPGAGAVVEALDLLGQLHLGRNRRPIAVTLGRLLAAVRAHAGFAAWPNGEQALANCLRVLDLARRYERGGAASFRAFVERLETEAERGQAADAPAVEEGTEGVRVMTVHRAKGLEFPVVVLADPTCRASSDRPGRHVDANRGLWVERLCGCAPIELIEAGDEERARDAEESIRLTYVAATRARDLLVVPVVGDEEVDGWTSVLHPATYPSFGNRRRAAEAVGCPPFGRDTVLDRPSECERSGEGAVQPGAHTPKAGAHRVVWWDPKRLTLDVDDEPGLRRSRLLEADAEAPDAEAAGVHDHDAWQSARRRELDAGRRPSLEVVPVTEHAATSDGAAPPAPVAVEYVSLDRTRRPRGLRFGTLVHAVLAAVPLDADDEAVEAVAALQGRIVGAPPEEVEAASRTVTAALGHPLLRRAAVAATAGALRREAPMTLRLGPARLTEGIVDLAFRDDPDGPWTVVDFKTDFDLAAHRARYERQIATYAEAVATATGATAHAILLVV